MLKQCSQCKKFKTQFEFKKEKRNKAGITCWCHTCTANLSRKHYWTNRSQKLQQQKLRRLQFPWESSYYHLVTRCTNVKDKAYYRYGGRGIQCLITKDEVKELWFRDKAYLMKKPSIDRKDNDGHYIYENCRFIEQSQNSKNNSRIRSVFQYDLEENFIQQFQNIKEASVKLNIQNAHICLVLQGHRKTAGGFIWRRQ